MDATLECGAAGVAVTEAVFDAGAGDAVAEGSAHAPPMSTVPELQLVHCAVESQLMQLAVVSASLVRLWSGSSSIH